MAHNNHSDAGRALGKLGGPARAKSLTAAKRKAIARKAAQARWKKYRAQKKEDVA